MMTMALQRNPHVFLAVCLLLLCLVTRETTARATLRQKLCNPTRTCRPQEACKYTILPWQSDDRNFNCMPNERGDNILDELCSCVCPGGLTCLPDFFSVSVFQTKFISCPWTCRTPYTDDSFE